MSNLGKQHLEKQTAICGAGVYNIYFAKRRNYHILTHQTFVFFIAKERKWTFFLKLSSAFFAVLKYNALKKNYHENRQYYI